MTLTLNIHNNHNNNLIFNKLSASTNFRSQATIVSEISTVFIFSDTKTLLQNVTLP